MSFKIHYAPIIKDLKPKYEGAGYIYPVLRSLIAFVHLLSLVEFIKTLFLTLSRVQTDQEKKRVSNLAIDSFILFKWIFIVFLIWLDTDSYLAFWSVCYLIFYNSFTYFYHHVWHERNYSHSNSQPIDWHRRRFLYFLIAITFYLVCYTHLYYSHVFHLIDWPDDANGRWEAFQLSMSNAFTLTYNDFQPSNRYVRLLYVTELINTFVFFTIVIVNSVPQRNSE